MGKNPLQCFIFYTILFSYFSSTFFVSLFFSGRKISFWDLANILRISPYATYIIPTFNVFDNGSLEERNLEQDCTKNTHVGSLLCQDSLVQQD